tara:strand:+ start:5304 stop:8222 length:2919 start_codon:yes stop_codon:yes gene_type:complete
MKSKRQIRSAIALISACVLIGCQLTAPQAVVQTLTISPNDQRGYLTFVMPNKLKVMVISDPNADRSAAALSVFYGSLEDPENRSGLAHFLEHMLFLGTAKYPEPDDYGQYISTHGGSDNAYTASDHTNYFFNIEPDFLEPALDRFSQFFIAPLFSADYVDREKNAVNSEYQLRLKDDGRRVGAAKRQIYNPDHPMSRFHVGSLETLSDGENGNVRNDLIRFYRDHYSANRMALVILGQESTEQLAAWARTYFSAVPDRSLAVAEYPTRLFAEGQLPLRLQVQPIKEQRNISWEFPVPPFDKIYRKNPATYIGNILGHEGRGSLHALLKKLGWIESLAAGGGRLTSEQGMLSVSIALTEAGMKHQLEIGDLLFRYIGLVKRSGVEQWLFQEQSLVSQLYFDFQEKAQPQSYVTRIASNYLYYPDHDVLYGPYALTEFDAELIHDYLEFLRPDNVVVTQVSPVAQSDGRDPWYDVPYKADSLPDLWRTRWQKALLADDGVGPSADLAADLAMVSANPFLPENLELIDEQVGTVPVQVRNSDRVRAWLLSDTEFGVPRASLRLRLESDRVYTTPDQAVKAQLFTRLVNDALNEYAYPALLAGLGYGVQSGSRGITIRLSGYDDKQDLLLDRILSTLKTLDIDGKVFERYKQQMLRGLRNTRQNPPYVQAMAEVPGILLQPSWSPADLEEALQTVTANDVAKWQRGFLTSLHLEALFHGNVTARAADEILDLVEAQLLEDAPARPFLPHRKLVKLDADHGYVRTLAVDHEDAAMVLYVQGVGQGYAQRASYGLLVQILRTPYFNDMRTEKQLGYVARASSSMMVDTPGIVFMVQSPVAGPDRLVQLTRAFSNQFRQQLVEMSAEQFRQNQAAFVNGLLQKDQNLGQRSGRLWGDFSQGVLTFDSREQLAREAEKLTRQDMITLFDSILTDLHSRFLLVYSPGRFDVEEMDIPIIDDPLEFKKTRQFFQLATDRKGS